MLWCHCTWQWQSHAYAVTSTSLEIGLLAFFFVPPALILHLAPKHGGQDWFVGVSWCGLPPGPHSLLQVRNWPPLSLPQQLGVVLVSQDNNSILPWQHSSCGHNRKWNSFGPGIGKPVPCTACFFISARWSFEISVTHILGQANVAADAASRNDLPNFFLAVFHASRTLIHCSLYFARLPVWQGSMLDINTLAGTVQKPYLRSSTIISTGIWHWKVTVPAILFGIRSDSFVC